MHAITAHLLLHKQDIIKSLKAKGHKEANEYSPAAIVGVAVQDDDQIYANSDYRKGGDVAGIDPE